MDHKPAEHLFHDCFFNAIFSCSAIKHFSTNFVSFVTMSSNWYFMSYLCFTIFFGFHLVSQGTYGVERFLRRMVLQIRRDSRRTSLGQKIGRRHHYLGKQQRRSCNKDKSSSWKNAKLTTLPYHKYKFKIFLTVSKIVFVLVLYIGKIGFKIRLGHKQLKSWK